MKLRVFGFLIIPILLLQCGEQKERPLNNDDVSVFEIQLLDNRGQVLQHVRQDTGKSINTKVSLGVFGEKFHPTQTDNGQVEKNDAEIHEIYLHLENNSNPEPEFVSLNFSFPAMNKWKPGEYKQPKISKENRINAVHKYWELRKEQQKGAHRPGSGVSSYQDLDESDVFINFITSSKGINPEYKRQRHIFYSHGGSVTLDRVGDEQIRGAFSVKVTGVPESLFDSKEFPDDPKMQTFQLTGEFDVVRGDHETLQGISADLRNIHSFMNRVYEVTSD